MGELVIVSNRGPFSFCDEFLTQAEDCLAKGTRPEPPKFGEGGLVNAMAGLLKNSALNPTWVGGSLGDRDIDVARGHYTELFKRMEEEGHAPEFFPQISIGQNNRLHFRYREYDFHMRYVFFDKEHMYSYYSQFANGFLWPLLHLTRSPLFYKKTKAFPRPHFEKNDFIQYTSSAATFANTVIDEMRRSEEFRKKDGNIVVWNQDYHLLQIAETCRAVLRTRRFSEEHRKRVSIGQFIHTPFFDIHEIQGLMREDKRTRVKAQVYDPFGETIESVLQKLTWGMLSNDFVGFHTKEYCDNYLEALEEWFPVKITMADHCYQVRHQERKTTVAALPIGLDTERILLEVTGNRRLEYFLDGQDLYETLMSEKQKGRYLFGGLERCDYTKGLIERMAIFRHVLARLRDGGKDAFFYQVTAPSRSENPDYKYLQTILHREVRDINTTLPGKPLTYSPKGIPPPQNYRFMKEMDVMFVTPLEDGMNLVAFEYILSQKFRRPEERGILVLSTSGASRVLKKKGFGEEDGIIYVNPMKPKEGGEKTAEALKKQRHLSERVIRYVEQERRVDDWAQKNVDAIVHARKAS
jgi:trehalose-6-phosphate synthase